MSSQGAVGSGSTSLGTHTHLGLRWTISKESPSCSVIHLLSSLLLGIRHPPASAEAQGRFTDSVQQHPGTLSIGEVRRVHFGLHHQSVSIHQKVPFAAVYLLGSVSYPRTPLFLRSSPTGCPRWPRSELLGDLPEGGFASAE
jgi:hypothetical protein